MDFVQLLKDDLEKGYSKSDLEKLIGLPKNNLSGILKGDRKLSKKSQLKIERWDKSEKPDPLTLHDLVYANGAKVGQVVDKEIIDLAKDGGFKGTSTITNTPREETAKKVSTLVQQVKESMIPRLEGESSLDYRIRCEELKSKTN